jgi:hypothetical protein
MFVALYDPTLSPGQRDPSLSNFPNEDEAWEYIFSQMCESCKKQIDSQKDYGSEDSPSEFPGCSY